MTEVKNDTNAILEKIEREQKLENEVRKLVGNDFEVYEVRTLSITTEVDEDEEVEEETTEFGIVKIRRSRAALIAPPHNYERLNYEKQLLEGQIKSMLTEDFEVYDSRTLTDLRSNTPYASIRVIRSGADKGE